MKKTIVRTLAAVVAVTAFAAMADWDPGDPVAQDNAVQMPDVTGWDVDFQNNLTADRFLADDWLLKTKKEVRDIHFWTSIRQAENPDDYWDGVSFTIGLFADVPQSDQADYSMPGKDIAYFDLQPGDYSVRKFSTAGTDDWEGYFDPYLTTSAGGPVYNENDHQDYWQVNYYLDKAIVLGPGTYWVGIQAVDDTSKPVDIGWKTSETHWNDTAVYLEGGQWKKLIDPVDQTGLDLAFAVTPEPSTAGLFLLGGLVALARRRRRS